LLFLSFNLECAAKSPLALVAGGLLNLSICLASLHQAIAVRRHGGPMMMVVTVMAVALHLFQTIREDPVQCQILICLHSANLAC